MNTKNDTGFSDDELQGLTPDELAALSDDDGQSDSETGTDPDDYQARPELDQLNELNNDEGQPAHAKADAKADDSQDDSQAEQKPRIYNATAPDDAAEQLATQQAIRAQAKADDKEALKKLHSGEIDFDEYEAIKDKAEEAREAADEAIGILKQTISKAEISAEMAQQEAGRAWAAEVKGVMTTGKAEGLDYAANPQLHKELNGLVRAFAMEATESGMSDEGLKASKWALQQAHSTMRTRHPELFKPQASTARREAGQQRHTVTTLGGLPSADRNPIGSEIMGRIAGLVGDDHEKAMGAMSEKDMEQLLKETDR